MDKNFRVRFVVGVCLFIVAIVFLYIFDSLLLKISFGFFALIALAELMSFFKKKFGLEQVILALIETALLGFSVVFISKIDAKMFWYLVLAIPGYDVFAYVFGRVFGGKVFGKSRPFPKISKNKTWEGTILGLMVAEMMVIVMMAIRGEYSTEWPFLLCPFLAMLGDLFESFIKRKFGIKDSNEIIIKNKFFAPFEMLIGGSSGHGGYLDRIDSTALTCTVLLILALFV